MGEGDRTTIDAFVQESAAQQNVKMICGSTDIPPASSSATIRPLRKVLPVWVVRYALLSLSSSHRSLLGIMKNQRVSLGINVQVVEGQMDMVIDAIVWVSTCVGKLRPIPICPNVGIINT